MTSRSPGAWVPCRTGRRIVVFGAFAQVNRGLSITGLTENGLVFGRLAESLAAGGEYGLIGVDDRGNELPGRPDEGQINACFSSEELEGLVSDCDLKEATAGVCQLLAGYSKLAMQRLSEAAFLRACVLHIASAITLRKYSGLSA